MVNGGSLDILR